MNVIKLRAVDGLAMRERFEAGNYVKQIQSLVGGPYDWLNWVFPKEAGDNIACLVRSVIEFGHKGSLWSERKNEVLSRCVGDVLYGDAVFVKHTTNGDTLGLTLQECKQLEQYLESKGANLAEED